MKVMPFITSIPTFIISFFNYYFTTKFDEEAFQPVLPMWQVIGLRKQYQLLHKNAFYFWFQTLYRFPFDSKQPMGYTIAITLQILLGMCLCTITAVCIAVGFGTFLLTISMTKDIKDDLILINKIAKIKKNRTPALKQLTELIRYHSKAKQLAHDFSDVFQPIFMVLFTWSILTMCTSMLLIQIDIVSELKISLDLISLI